MLEFSVFEVYDQYYLRYVLKRPGCPAKTRKVLQNVGFCPAIKKFLVGKYASCQKNLGKAEQLWYGSFTRPFL